MISTCLIFVAKNRIFQKNAWLFAKQHDFFANKSTKSIKRIYCKQTIKHSFCKKYKRVSHRTMSGNFYLEWVTDFFCINLSGWISTCLILLQKIRWKKKCISFCKNNKRIVGFPPWVSHRFLETLFLTHFRYHCFIDLELVVVQ